MKLLGERNWWAPEPLRRFHHRFGLHEAPSSTPPAAPGDAGLRLASQDHEPALDSEPVGAGLRTTRR
jgi:hypothetical protein